MEAILSKSVGILAFPNTNKGKPKFIDFISDIEINEKYFLQSYSMVEDWESINYDSIEKLLQTASLDYWNERTKSLLIDALILIDTGLVLEILERVNEIISTNANINKVIDKLLIAPLESTKPVETLHNLAYANGYSAVASIANSLLEYQPHINRFVDIWLNVEDKHFNKLSIDKSSLWRKVIENTNFVQLISSSNQEHFQKTWGALVFHFKNLEDRTSLTSLGSQISEILHPKDNNYSNKIRDLSNTHKHTEDLDFENFNSSSFDTFSTHQRIKQQIDGVIDSIKTGHDNKANKILRELIDFQSSMPGGKDFLVKTLCNIAKKSSEQLRYDYEKKCLQIALDLNPSDNWTFIQYADHLKRVGEFQHALNVVEEAKVNSLDDITLSLEADIFRELGDYDKALSLYSSIENWDRKKSIVNAVADLQRHIGDYEIAEKLYKRIINNDSFIDEYDDHYRAQVGLAEIKKQKGKLIEASKYYKNLLQRSKNEHDKYYFRLGLCNVLKLKGDYEESFKYNEENISNFPFATQPKFIRASLFSLMSRNDEAISYLLSIDNDIFNKWLYRYYEGLMLLKLEKNIEARQMLVDNINDLEITVEEKVLLRFGAALSSLSVNDIVNANAFLANTNSISSYFMKYLQLVLSLHLAALENDTKTYKQVLSKIDSLSIDDNDIKSAINAIKSNDFKTAIIHEINCLFRLAS